MLESLRRFFPLGFVLAPVLACLLFAGPGDADDRPGPEGGDPARREAAKPLDPREHGIGRRIGDLEFVDLDGKRGKLSEYASSKALVLVFRSNGCPLSQKTSPALKKIIDDFSSRQVAFLLVDPIESDDAASIQKSLAEFSLSLRATRDAERRFAQALGAERTTDVFVLDAARTLIYRGAISDQYGIGFVRAAPEREFLREALEAVLSSQRAAIEATRAPGCELGTSCSWEDPAGAPTWHERISRIVQRSCQECHRPGESAPFALETYKQAKANAAMIEQVVSDRTMPPWFADPKTGHWANDRSLSDSDRKALLGWIKAGCPEGDAAAAPKPRSWTAGWRLGKPDSIISLPRAIPVPAEGVVEYKYVRIKTAFSEDKWVRAVEVRPGAPEVVHHVLVFVRYPEDHLRAREQPNDRGGLRGYFAGMVPGQGTLELPPNCAKLLPKGAELIVQLHYTTSGKAVSDQTRMGFYFSSEPKHEVRTFAVSDTKFRIPANTRGFKVEKSEALPTDTRILAFAPHMHVRGQAFKYEAILPGGEVRTLLDIPAYDFNWQLTYQLREPIDLPKGTVIRATALFDNSRENPANPNPDAEVRFGEQTWEEMMIGYMNGYELKPDTPKPEAPKAKRSKF